MKRFISAGARAARGEILVFTDADNRLHPQTFNAIDEAMAAPDVAAGASGVRIDRWSPGILATFVMMMPLIWLTGMDTGAVFCRREDFEAVGGYNEGRLFAEDVELLMALWRRGRPHGRRLRRLRGCKALTSARKFDTFGDWHYFGLVARFLLSVAAPGRSMDRFARRYWYPETRERRNRGSAKREESRRS